RSLGSSTSRIPSPIRFSAKTVIVNAAPGTSMVHGAWERNTRDSESMPPHDGISGGAPAPRNDNVASPNTASAKTKLVWTITGERQLGVMCRNRIRDVLDPIDSAASTN